jgi:hypothetical protein
MTQPTRPSRRRTALLVLGLLLAGLVAGGFALFGGSPKHPAAAPRPAPAPTPRATPSPSPSPFDPNAIPAGTCFNSPGLSDISTVQVVPCTGPHDAESVSVITLPSGLASASALLTATCSHPLTAKWDLQPDRTALHVWNRYPDITEYRAGHVHATCAISASITVGGTKLHAPLR